MSIIQFLAKSKTAKIALIGLVGTASLVTLAGNIYIRFHYAAAMPRSPQPETGRLYALPAQGGGVIYVNQEELDRRNFFRNDLVSVCAVGGLLLFFLGTQAGWFPRGKKLGDYRLR